MLELVGLDPAEYGKRYPAQLSGGQQQRVGLARALASDPPLMLMDEPFSAVDPITRERLQNDFLRLHRAVPKTVVFVSHDIDEAVKMADRIAVMRDGHLVQYAPPSELLAAPADEFVADFVGADRALKGLSLTRIEEIDLEDAPLVEAGAASSDVLGRIANADLAPVDGDLLISVDGRPRAWMSVERATDSDQVPNGPVGSPGPIIDRLATLRDALSALLDANARAGAVVDAEGRCVGLVSVDSIQGSWNTRSTLASHG
jgi:osmoprotectant transport system ATP-binding protein